ncbi:MAG: hypothetical protein ACJ8AT_26930 [Hyalangium sp.]|uniref:hypothetical protein n=1 Tax=Hyalangium sp. TaxID=2028555 RepID=UPI00389AD993
MRFCHSVSLIWLWLAGCTSQSEIIATNENYGEKDGGVWVRGPWGAVKPSKDIDEVIDQLCPAVMALPRATFGDYGAEYCGIIYSLEDGTYYASHASPLGKDVRLHQSRRKQCQVPNQVVDSRGQPEFVADFHGHPWAGSEMSQWDMKAANQLYSIRVQFDTECRVLKLIPYKKEDRPGEVYAREGKSWRLVGVIKPEHKADGIMTPVER